jgi:hypothetical protein
VFSTHSPTWDAQRRLWNYVGEKALDKGCKTWAAAVALAKLLPLHCASPRLFEADVPRLGQPRSLVFEVSASLFLRESCSPRSLRTSSFGSAVEGASIDDIRAKSNRQQIRGLFEYEKGSLVCPGYDGDEGSSLQALLVPGPFEV